MRKRSRLYVFILKDPETRFLEVKGLYPTTSSLSAGCNFQIQSLRDFIVIVDLY